MKRKIGKHNSFIRLLYIFLNELSGHPLGKCAFRFPLALSCCLYCCIKLLYLVLYRGLDVKLESFRVDEKSEAHKQSKKTSKQTIIIIIIIVIVIIK